MVVEIFIFKPTFIFAQKLTDYLKAAHLNNGKHAHFKNAILQLISLLSFY